MKIVYATLTNQVTTFLKKYKEVHEIETIEIDPSKEIGIIDDKFILLLPSYEEFPFYDEVDDILLDNLENCMGIIGTGNINYDKLYMVTAKIVSKKYKLPLLYGFEFAGNDRDIKLVNQIISDLEKYGKVVPTEETEK